MPDIPTLKASAFFGQDLCEHQVLSQAPDIEHGEGRDKDAVTICVGDACMSFDSARALIAELARREGRGLQAVSVAG